jgi:hypothetical protein
MARRKSAKRAREDSRAPQPPIKQLFSEQNRGLLLDVFVFLANILVMGWLSEWVIGLFHRISAEDPTAKLLLGLIFLAMWILPALGAVLKRWHFHQRLRAAGKTFDSEYSKLAGCLFNPIFYFCLNLVITSAVLTGLGDALFGKALTNNGAVFVPLVIAGLLLTIVQTFLIYQYFSAPKKEPRSEFLKHPQSELLGNLCIFLNMTFFQIFWNMLTFAPLRPPDSVLEFGGRLFFFSFIALLVYFPPRMFYLAEDIHRPRTWLTMLLANSPVILRVLVGTDANAMGGW